MCDAAVVELKSSSLEKQKPMAATTESRNGNAGRNSTNHRAVVPLTGPDITALCRHEMSKGWRRRLFLPNRSAAVGDVVTNRDHLGKACSYLPVEHTREIKG